MTHRYNLYRLSLLNSAWNVAAVVLVLLPYIQDDSLLRVHHLPGLFPVDLLGGGLSSALAASERREQRGGEGRGGEGNDLLHHSTVNN